MPYEGTAAISGLATTVSVGSTGTGTPTYTPIAEVRSITQSGAVNKTWDATNLSSTYEEWICVIPSSGKLDLECNYLAADAGQLAVKASFDGHTTLFYQAVLPNSKTYTFLAIVEEYESLPKVAPNDGLTVKIGLKISGPIVLTSGS
jgi:hypothetical protein